MTRGELLELLERHQYQYEDRGYEISVCPDCGFVRKKTGPSSAQAKQCVGHSDDCGFGIAIDQLQKSNDLDAQIA
jgi:hypothetical protein